MVLYVLVYEDEDKFFKGYVFGSRIRAYATKSQAKAALKTTRAPENVTIAKFDFGGLL